MIKVLYCDIESILKVIGALSSPFKIQRGTRQGCAQSGMLYSIALGLKWAGTCSGTSDKLINK